MGKPYQSELRKLPETYRWAVSQDIEKLIYAIRTAGKYPLIAVGSGGSFSVAENMVSCQQHYFGNFARAVTPLELLSALPLNGNASVWFFSASGGNIDIKRAFEHTLLREPRHVAGMVGKLGSPLRLQCEKHQYADLFEYDLPAGRDGFLATNSLFAFTILICRGYCEAFKRGTDVPKTFDSLLSNALPHKINLNNLEKYSESLWGKTTLHVLYSNQVKAAAIDIESKFIEAGLGSVHLSDFRNFAHGRHHWLAKHEETSAIIALSVPADSELAAKTLQYIPKNIPRLHLPLAVDGAAARISSIILSLYLAGYAGRAKGIDPGRPGVPPFGSKIYHLRAKSGFVNSIDHVEIAIQRKVGTRSDYLSEERNKLWLRAYRSFKKRILKARFGGLVMDYDGTVVDSRNRFVPPTSAIVGQLVRLLSAGVVMGFATGRGKSIRKDLQSVIPKKYWKQVVIGYYNGAEISFLTDNHVPDSTSPPCSDLQKILTLLKNDIEIISLAKVEPRKMQLTVEPTSIVPENLLWELAQDELVTQNSLLVDVYRSSHSIDILARGVSKSAVVKRVVKESDAKVDVLTIGDRGKWPGNDSVLLKHAFSLSVDEVSSSKDTCWNLCPAGVRGPQGTLYYLKNLIPVPEASLRAVKFKSLGE